MFLTSQPQNFEGVHISQVTHTIIWLLKFYWGALTPSLVLSSEEHYLAAAWFIAGCCSLHLEVLLIVITTQPLLGSQSPF